MSAAKILATWIRIPVCWAVLGAAVGCSSSPANETATHDAAAPADAGAQPAFSMSLDVPAGGEKFMCQLVSFPRSGYVTTEAHDMTPGSHHFLLYTTDLSAIPAGEGAVEDCNANDGSIMNHVRGMFYAAGGPHAEMSFPPGVGMPVTENQVLLLQVHYLNAGSATLHASVRAYFTLAPPGDDIREKASILFWYDPFIDVPAGQKATARLRCPIPANITLLSAAPHFHARGAGYSAYVDRSTSPPSSMPFYTTGGWNDTEAFLGPFDVAAGSQIRFECFYDNTNGTREFFQGPSAATNEMCMFIATYYPALGSDADFCAKGMDMYGTGESGCVDTLKCLGACGASPPDAGSSASPAATASENPGEGTTSLSPCLQQCFLGACPAFSGTVMSVVTCMQQRCAVPCGLAQADGGTSTGSGFDGGNADAGNPDRCTPCLESQCASMTAECGTETTCGPTGGL